MDARSLYKHHDVDGGGFVETHPDEARRVNPQGWGIFRSINAFEGPRRIENLAKVCGWAVDIDDGLKAEQAELIRRAPLRPSTVVESFRGYQPYYRAKDGTQGNWERIMRDRLIPYFQGDANAKDLARVLREPGFFHMKDPRVPFLVRTVLDTGAMYSEDQMLRSFLEQPDYYEELRQTRKPDRSRARKPGFREGAGSPSRPYGKEKRPPIRLVSRRDGENRWDKVYAMDQRELLAALSGRREIGGDQIAFRRNRKGDHQIFVNGKSTACWVDSKGRIGSHDKGGPSVIEWGHWHGYSKGEVMAAVEHEFPELRA